MKKFLFLFLLCNLLFSQEVVVKYKLHTNLSHRFSSTIENFTLTQNEQQSLFELDDINDNSQFKYKDRTTLLKATDSLNVYVVNEEGFLYLYKKATFKDYKNNFQVSNQRISLNFHYIKDEIDIFNWQIENSKDTIIAGYTCQKATTTFRGRDYEAYYTSELANQGGPWKFDGLPGLILAVVSKDGYLFIEPIKINIKNNIVKINNPFLYKKTIFFKDLATKFLENDKIRLARTKSRPNPPDKTIYGPPELIENTGLGERVYE